MRSVLKGRAGNRAGKLVTHEWRFVADYFKSFHGIEEVAAKNQVEKTKVKKQRWKKQVEKTKVKKQVLTSKLGIITPSV